jgi:hypothetical protein
MTSCIIRDEGSTVPVPDRHRRQRDCVATSAARRGESVAPATENSERSVYDLPSIRGMTYFGESVILPSDQIGGYRSCP